MPLYDFTCTDCGETTEELVALVDGRPPQSIECRCGEQKQRQPSAPKFKLQWALPPMDDPKEIWEGTPLAGTDGINETHYRSTKSFSL